MGILTTAVIAPISLHQELVDFYNLMKPTADGHQCRYQVFTRIQQAIVEIWPGAKVQTFGSFNTKLYPPNRYVTVLKATYKLVLIKKT